MAAKNNKNVLTPEELNHFLVRFINDTVTNFCFRQTTERTLPVEHHDYYVERQENSSQLVIRTSGNKDKFGNLRRFEIFRVRLNRD